MEHFIYEDLFNNKKMTLKRVEAVRNANANVKHILEHVKLSPWRELFGHLQGKEVIKHIKEHVKKNLLDNFINGTFIDLHNGNIDIVNSPPFVMEMK